MDLERIELPNSRCKRDGLPLAYRSLLFNYSIIELAIFLITYRLYFATLCHYVKPRESLTDRDFYLKSL